MSDQVVRISKFLSLVLRHDPQKIGLELDAQGWAQIDELLHKMSANGISISREVLEEVVAENNKQRFKVSECGLRIRANQGHSISVELGLQPKKPPELLFHGTATKNRKSILQTGLNKQSRQHVHLSADRETAVKVAVRHGKPIVFLVDTKAMQGDDYQFFQSENGVWLIDHVPAKYLSEAPGQPQSSG